MAAQVWLFPDGGVTYPGERLPEAGWVWLVQAGDPVLTRPPTTQPDGLQTTAAPGSAPAGGPL